MQLPAAMEEPTGLPVRHVMRTFRTVGEPGPNLKIWVRKKLNSLTAWISASHRDAQEELHDLNQAGLANSTAASQGQDEVLTARKVLKVVRQGHDSRGTKISLAMIAREGQDLTVQKEMNLAMIARQGQDLTVQKEMNLAMIARQGQDLTVQREMSLAMIARQGQDLTVQKEISLAMIAREDRDLS
jgi:hypothetical protein